MDYLGALSLIGSGPQGKAGREILAGLPELPTKLDEAWCVANAATIDAWLANTDGTCVDNGRRAYNAIKPLLKTDAVRRLRMIATDCYGVFPDCTFRALVTVATKFNRLTKGANHRTLDRVAAKLDELCRLYALQVRLLLKRHEQLSSFLSRSMLSELTKAVEGNSYNKKMLAELLRVPKEQVDHELKRYIRRADETLWVLRGDAL